MDTPLDVVTTPQRFDVILKRVPKLQRLNPGDPAPTITPEPSTNVPRSVVSHSPDGFEWGYGGSGPADLALNVLNAFVPPGTDGLPPVKCFRGVCSKTAYRLHQRFKEEIISSLPHQGGMIPCSVIEDWLASHFEEIVERV